jgi:hypothetical protein
MDIFGTPPSVRSVTSRMAAEQIKPHTPKLRSLVLGYIQANGPCTDEEIQRGLNMEGSTQRPRRVELLRASLIEDSGEKGTTSSGRLATKWRVVDAHL